MSRRNLAHILIGLGLLGIVWGVLHVLETANGPGPGARRFQDRRSYNQVKESVHASFPGGLLRAGVGISLMFLGTRLRRQDPPAPSNT